MTTIASVGTFNAPSSLPPMTRLTDQGAADPHIVVGTDALFGSQNFDPNALTPDALLTYLSTRLNSINDQTQTVLDRQKSSEKVRGEIGEIQKILSTVNKNETNKNAELVLSAQDLEEIEAHIGNIISENETLGKEIWADFKKEGQLLHNVDSDATTPDKYVTTQLENTQQYLSTVCKDIESSAQMDMITLQSLMGARQTAIQLSTNLVSALNESMKAVVSNIR